MMLALLHGKERTLDKDKNMTDLDPIGVLALITGIITTKVAIDNLKKSKRSSKR